MTGGNPDADSESAGNSPTSASADADNQLDYLGGLPATDVLDQFPVPVLALHKDGFVVYANRAFAEMLGWKHTTLLNVAVNELLASPNGKSAGEMIREKVGAMIDLRHREGWTVHALVSSSALARSDDPVSLVALHDVTEQLWARTKAEHFGWGQSTQ